MGLMRRARGTVLQTEIAKKVGIHTTTISRYETGISPPSRAYVDVLIELNPHDLELCEELRSLPLNRGSAPYDPKEENRTRLIGFLGNEVRQVAVRLIYPTFEFTPAAKAALRGIKNRTIYEKPRLYEHGRGTGVLQPVAANDIRALCTATVLLAEFGLASTMLPDSEVRRTGADFPTISFGLSSNDMVHFYMDLCTTAGTSPLFELSRDRSATIRLADGRTVTYEDEKYGLLARVTPDQHRPDRRWFFCAGVGPAGTEASTNFLVKNWEWISTKAGDEDFVLLVHCNRDNPSISHAGEEDLILPSQLTN